jgi:hypothetical protein
MFSSYGHYVTVLSVVNFRLNLCTYEFIIEDPKKWPRIESTVAENQITIKENEFKVLCSYHGASKRQNEGISCTSSYSWLDNKLYLKIKEF